jgi:hypothetical protein
MALFPVPCSLNKSKKSNENEKKLVALILDELIDD